LLLAPLAMLTGVLLRIQFHFFFPQQLEAFAQHPALIAASYSCFLAGNILLWPAILTLACRIGVSCPGWAQWGASLCLFGLFGRTFHAGIDHLAFQLVRAEGPAAATGLVAGSYGAFHIVSTLNGAILAGWIVLAVGAVAFVVVEKIADTVVGHEDIGPSIAIDIADRHPQSLSRRIRTPALRETSVNVPSQLLWYSSAGVPSNNCGSQYIR
jgi:hypothetical protein